MPNASQSEGKLKKDKGPPRRLKVTAERRHGVMAKLARAKTAFESVRELLTPDVARSMGDVYYVYWSALTQYYEENNGLPAKSYLEDAIAAFVSARPDLLSENEVEELDALVARAYKDPNEEISAEQPQNVRWLTGQVRLLYEDWLSEHVRDTLVDDAQGLVPQDLGGRLAEYQVKAEQVKNMTGHGVVEVFENGWETQEEPKLYPMGFDLFDPYLDGGLIGSEVITFMAPTGSCKTLVSVQVAVLEAHKARDMHAATNFSGPTPVVLIASFEEPPRELRIRILAQEAKVIRSRACKPLSKLYDKFMPVEQQGNPNWYERFVFPDWVKDPSLACKSERERVAEAAQLLQHYIRIIDFSPEAMALRGGTYGRGGVPEIAAQINSYRRQAAIVPFFVVADHAAAMASNMMAISPKADQFWLRKTLEGMPLQMRQHLAAPYACPVMITHQIAGEACRRSPTLDLDNTFGQDCKTFCTYANFGFWGGRVGDDNLTRFGCAKHRRAGPLPARTILINGAFNEIYDVDERYTVAGGRFVKQESAGTVGKVPPKAVHAHHH